VFQFEFLARVGSGLSPFGSGPNKPDIPFGLCLANKEWQLLTEWQLSTTDGEKRTSIAEASAAAPDPTRPPDRQSGGPETGHTTPSGGGAYAPISAVSAFAPPFSKADRLGCASALGSSPAPYRRANACYHPPGTPLSQDSPLNLPPDTGSVVTEADVELKVVTPLLTSSKYLAIPTDSIKGTSNYRVCAVV